jgi:hypothetical protein
MKSIEETKKYRVIVTVTLQEKAALKVLAMSSQRSMAGYLRHLLIREIDDNFESE